VLRRVHDDHVLEDRELMAVLFDEFADVIALGGERQRWERPADRVDRRERVDVLERSLHLLIAGDRHHAVVRLTNYRPLAAQVIPIGVGILGDLGVGEVIGLG
jgi:hypothetical protein